MATLVLLNKPFQVMCQFTDTEARATLADFVAVPDVYPAGRLDYDSEGLLLLTDNGRLQQQISHPAFKQPKTYWVQVEGAPDTAAMEHLRKGLMLKDGPTRPAKVSSHDSPDWLWSRHPPIRQRKDDVTSWLKLEITEGRNRQVRRMTAAIGHPTLRLLRTRIGPWSLADLAPGDWRQESVHLPPRRARRQDTRQRG